jgi:hypothetical protein
MGLCIRTSSPCVHDQLALVIDLQPFGHDESQGDALGLPV